MPDLADFVMLEKTNWQGGRSKQPDEAVTQLGQISPCLMSKVYTPTDLSLSRRCSETPGPRHFRC